MNNETTNKISLYGFNNLTKNLSFSLYKLHYIHDANQLVNYQKFINASYSADKLNKILNTICHTIGGSVLNVAMQDYQPHGASVTLMISEEAQPAPLEQTLIAHLDKSHLCIHTYPEDQLQNNIAIFRADIELSTCGIISPLKVLNYLIEEFCADVIEIDYRVRGMTRNKHGAKCFRDHDINNISDFLSTKTLQVYQSNCSNFPKQNLYHSKLSRKKITLEQSLFEFDKNDLTAEQQEVVAMKIEDNIKQLFTCAT